jgi:pheromone a factor receptor
MIGTVSLFYCCKYPALASHFSPVAHLLTAMNIYQLYKRVHQVKEMISSNSGLNRGLYIRLMVLSSVEIFGTIPLASYYMSLDVKEGIERWVSWAYIHSDYSVVEQIPSIIWKHDSEMVVGVEMFRWSLVLCAFIFFAFFGFAGEARENYRRMFKWVVRRVRYLTSSGTISRSTHAYVVLRAFFECWSHIFSVLPPSLI